MMRIRLRNTDVGTVPVIFHVSLEVLWIPDVENGLVGEGPDGQLHAKHKNEVKKTATFPCTKRATVRCLIFFAS